MKHRLLWLLLLCGLTAAAQEKTQTIRGTVLDKETRETIIGATVRLSGTGTGALTDENGIFNIQNVPIGRHVVEVTAVGYEPFVSEGLIVNTVKEVVLNVELKQTVYEGGPVLITATAAPNAPLNDLAVVSGRSFSVEETERIPTAVNDPGRMALAYPGVSQGRDDSENLMIVRGNAPFGILWRLEGIDIPNPSHFAVPGSSGGGITVFSAQLLNRSDFYTGGMSADYGNCMAGAFDIRFRAGNMEKREHRAKIGLLGIDVATEGPFRKGQSSYLINYRYSTLGLLNQMGFYVVGPRVINAFQDLSFNVVNYSKDRRKTLTFFGLGGLSLQHNQPVTDPAERDPVGDPRTVQEWLRPANTGTLGMTYTAQIKDQSSIKWVTALIGSYIGRDYDTLNQQDVRYKYHLANYSDRRIASSLTYNTRFGLKTRLRAGVIGNFIQFDAYKFAQPRGGVVTDISAIDPRFGTIFDGKGQTATAQAYANLNRQLGKRLQINVGAHFLHLFLNNTNALDPRFSAQYRINSMQTISFAAGQYSQMLGLPVYNIFIDPIGDPYVNRNLKMPRSAHYILGYQLALKSRWKFTIEGYLQRLSRIPVGVENSNPVLNSYSVLNIALNYPEIQLVNAGKGRNMGVDVSVEKYFETKFYMLFTASVYQARYADRLGNWFNSAFNDRFSSALTLGREFNFANGNVLQTGLRVLYNGGFPYTPADLAASAAAGSYVPDATLWYAANTPNYFRPDLRLSYRINRPKTAWVMSLDIQNVANYINVGEVNYDATKNATTFRRNGDTLVPIISFQVDF